MTGTVEYTSMPGSYGLIKLRRKHKHHAISSKMAEEFMKCLEQALEDKSITFLAITAEGGEVFCSGGDLNEMTGDLNGDEAFGKLRMMKDVLWEIVSFPLPTICLLNGNAVGGGCEIATACDFRLTREGTSFGFIQSNLGILPGWGGGALLYEKVHSSFAYEWLMEGKMIDAGELWTKGWIHRCVPQEQWDDLEALLHPFQKSGNQARMLKAQYHEHIDWTSLKRSMEAEVRNCASLWGSTEHQAAIRRFRDKH